MAECLNSRTQSPSAPLVLAAPSHWSPRLVLPTKALLVPCSQLIPGPDFNCYATTFFSLSSDKDRPETTMCWNRSCQHHNAGRKICCVSLLELATEDQQPSVWWRGSGAAVTETRLRVCPGTNWSLREVKAREGSLCNEQKTMQNTSSRGEMTTRMVVSCIPCWA